MDRKHVSRGEKRYPPARSAPPAKLPREESYGSRDQRGYNWTVRDRQLVEHAASRSRTPKGEKGEFEDGKSKGGFKGKGGGSDKGSDKSGKSEKGDKSGKGGKFGP